MIRAPAAQKRNIFGISSRLIILRYPLIPKPPIKYLIVFGIAFSKAYHKCCPYSSISDKDYEGIGGGYLLSGIPKKPPVIVKFVSPLFFGCSIYIENIEKP